MIRPRALIIVSLLILLSAEGALAATTTPRELVEDATVNLYCRMKTSGRTQSITGSGVFIHESGVILTNAHVAQYFLLATSTSRTTARCSVRDGSPARARYDAAILYISPQWAQATVDATERRQPRTGTGERDFALLKIVTPERGKLPERFPALPVDLEGAQLEKGQEVIGAGYPAENLSFSGVQRKLERVVEESTITNVQSFERPHKDTIVLSPTPLSASGVSGGPVANSSGQLVGIVVTMETGSDSKKEERSLRAISTSYIDRTVRTETGFSLPNFIAWVNIGSGNPLLPYFADLRQTIEKTLRNSRD